MEIEIRPRKQFRAYLERSERFACLVVHRRGGKTFSCVQDLIYRALSISLKGRGNNPPRYSYIAPTRDQAKDIAWPYLKRFCSPIPGVTINESELKITFKTGVSIRLYSGDNYERMRGLYNDGVVIDESGDIDPRAWPEVIEPTLIDYLGWATWIGTPKGKNSFYETHVKASANPDWFTMTLKASESGLIDPKELARMKAETDPRIFNQEFECDFNVGLPGAIYAKEVTEARCAGHVIPGLMPDKSAPVHTSWDLGSPENTSVIYFQRVGPRILIVDHDKGLRLTTAERVAHMRAKGYTYGVHCLPHDGASTQAGGLSFADEITKAGLTGVRIIRRTIDAERRIQGMWGYFPNIYFNEENTKFLLKSLENYRRKEEKKSGYTKTEIVHDWASHDSDSFSYIYEAEQAGLLYDSSSSSRGPAIRKAVVNIGRL